MRRRSPDQRTHADPAATAIILASAVLHAEIRAILARLGTGRCLAGFASARRTDAI